MLEIEKSTNWHGYEVIYLKTDTGSIKISFEGNLDLYWNIETNNQLRDKYQIEITKENYIIYQMFDKLYTSIKNEKPFGDSVDYDYLWKHSVYNEYRLFKNGIIDWHSDDFDYDEASRLTIEPNDDKYLITFYQSKTDEFLFKTFTVRFRNSGSRYDPYNVIFMNMYHELIKYDPDYHQINFEEYLYNQKVKKLKKE